MSFLERILYGAGAIMATFWVLDKVITYLYYL